MKPEINYQTVVDTLVYEKIVDGKVLFTDSVPFANEFMSVQTHLGCKIIDDLDVTCFFKDVDTRYTLSGTTLFKIIDSLRVQERYILIVHDTIDDVWTAIFFDQVNTLYVPQELKENGAELKNMLRKGLV